MSLTLVFTSNGQVALEENDEQVWSSDNDDDFKEEIGDDFLNEEDSLRVLEYLMEQGIINEREAQLVSIDVEDDDENENGEDEDEDDVIDADFVEVEPSRQPS